MLDGNNMLTTQAELKSHIMAFYMNLYARDETVGKDDASREDCFTFIKQSVTGAHNMELLRPLTMDEVSTAMKQLSTGKAPCVDSIAAKFCQKL